MNEPEQLQHERHGTPFLLLFQAIETGCRQTLRIERTRKVSSPKSRVKRIF